MGNFLKAFKGLFTTVNDKQLKRAYNFDAGRRKEFSNNFLLSNNWSIDKALNEERRKIMRQRAREEVFNNAWAFGAGQSLCSSVIGNGARVQLLTRGKERAICDEIENDFQAWAEEIELAAKLRAMRFSKYQDGEAFALINTNMNLESEVKLDITPIDCDRVTSNGALENYQGDNDFYLDGIQLDRYGNATKYRVLDFHPGGNYPFNAEATYYNSSMVIHWFKRITSEQHRGLPEIAPALDLFNSLRRYTDATIKAAETAASIAFCLYTDDADCGGDYEEGGGGFGGAESLQEFQVQAGRGLVLPDSFKLTQLDAKQPTQGFSDLVDNLLGQIGACIGLPRLVMRKSATGFNYASARVDLQAFYKFVKQEQAELVTKVLRPIWKRWFKEYCLLYGLNANDFHDTYIFEGEEPIDQMKEANAVKTSLEDNTTTLSNVFAKAGLDWKTQLEQIAREKAFKAELEKRYKVKF